MSLNRKSETDNFLIQPIKDDYSFKWNRLLFEDEEPFIFHDTKLNLKNEVIFDLWENSFDIGNKIHFNNHMQIHYEHNTKCVPFILRIENINGVIERGRDLKRVHYFKPTALIQTGLIITFLPNLKIKYVII